MNAKLMLTIALLASGYLGATGAYKLKNSDEMPIVHTTRECSSKSCLLKTIKGVGGMLGGTAMMAVSVGGGVLVYQAIEPHFDYNITSFNDALRLGGTVIKVAIAAVGTSAGVLGGVACCWLGCSNTHEGDFADIEEGSMNDGN